MTDQASPTPAGSRRGRPRTLDTTRVVQAALDLLDEEGSSGLSVRGVAARLGVRPNALYTYFADRAALERAVVDRLLAQADPAPLTGDGPWRDRIEHYARRLRQELLDRPGTVPLFFTAPMDGPHALLVGESLLRALTDAGLDPAQAARASYAIIVHTIGSAALAVADLPSPAVTDQALTAARRERLAAIDPAVAPLTAATIDITAAWNSEEQFRWGLHLLLDGCAKA